MIRQVDQLPGRQENRVDKSLGQQQSKSTQIDITIGRQNNPTLRLFMIKKSLTRNKKKLLHLIIEIMFPEGYNNRIVIFLEGRMDFVLQKGLLHKITVN